MSSETLSTSSLVARISKEGLHVGGMSSGAIIEAMLSVLARLVVLALLSRLDTLPFTVFDFSLILFVARRSLLGSLLVAS